MSLCLKRFPLVFFPRYYASAASSRAKKPIGSHNRPKLKYPNRPPPGPHILDTGDIRKHLDQLAETNGKLVLADIERCRPASHGTPGTPKYETEYTDLAKKIIGSFTAKQLQEFLKLYGLPSRDRPKLACAVAIMEEWDWPSLTTIQEQKRESQMDTETLPLTPPEAFLILGKYHVRMTYLANPLSLRVEGKVVSLNKLKRYIAELREAITEDIFELPGNKPIRSDLLQRISRLSGALTENFGENKIRVSFNKNNPRTALVAKRLAARAVCEENDSKQAQLFFHLPPSVPSSSPASPATTFHHNYALYPFLSTRSLPWTVSASGVFRVRRVEEWVGTGASEDLKKTGGLLMGRGRLVTVQQQETDLRTLLLARSSSGSRVVTASIGHTLLTLPPGEQVSIVPPQPLQGEWRLPHLLKWMEEQSAPTVFIPTLPPSLLNSRLVQPKMIHRLIYQAVNTGNDIDAAQKIIKVELVLPRSVKESATLPDPASESHELAEPEFPSRCWTGNQVDLNVLMPDRPADIRVSIFDSIVLATDQWPAVLGEYISNLRAFLLYQDPEASQPETPLPCLTVRQSVEPPDTSDPSSVQIVTESSLDLEGDQKSASCQVICDDVVSDASWDSFLRHCDAMSTSTARTTKHAPLL
ncbi:hypothetical protein B0H13DRAFT_1973766 [Mycena leptocephala]|nr:hypothetical protein B0H13DRAFT_1973766 [Mycena leptocephala]